MYQELKRTCTAIVLLIKIFCLATFPLRLVAVVVFLNFLNVACKEVVHTQLAPHTVVESD